MCIQRIAWPWHGGFFAALLILAGCNGSKPGEMKGTVKFEGKAIEKGAIYFYPVDGKSATAGGEIIDGQYSVKVPVGLMKVYIGVPKFAGTKKVYDTPDSPVRTIYTESIPEKYSSRDKTELQFDVKPGVNQKDWELE